MKKYKNFDEMFNDNDYVSEEDREKKGSPSWTALWFLHNSYRYGSFLFGNNLISA